MTKHELRQYRAMCAEIKQLQDLIEEVESRVYDPKLHPLTGLPGAPTMRNGSTQERTLDSVSSLLDYYRCRLDKLCCRQLCIEQAIDGLTGEQRLLMRYRYIQGLHWEKICVTMNVSWATAHRLHAAALQQVQGFSTTSALP